MVLHKDKKNIQKTINEVKNFIEKGDYQVDGIVFLLMKFVGTIIWEKRLTTLVTKWL